MHNRSWLVWGKKEHGIDEYEETDSDEDQSEYSNEKIIQEVNGFDGIILHDTRSI